MLIRYVEIGFCVAQRKSGETAAQVSCIRLPALQPATLLEAAEKGKTTNVCLNKNDKPSPQPSGSAYERGKEEFGGPPD